MHKLTLLNQIFLKPVSMDMVRNELNKNKNSLYWDIHWLQWFVGFNDAEGNFQVFPKKRILKFGEISKYNVGHSYHLSLHSRDALLIKTIKKKIK